MSNKASHDSSDSRRPAKASAPRRPGRGPFPAIGAAGDRLGRAARAGARQISENPLTAVAGAVAMSAGLALLLPAGRREAEVMGELADKVGDVARGAAENVVEIGRAEVEMLAQDALAGVGGAVVEALVKGERAGGGSRG